MRKAREKETQLPNAKAKRLDNSREGDNMRGIRQRSVRRFKCSAPDSDACQI